MEKRGNQDQGCFKMRIIEYHDYKTLMGPCFVSFSIPLLIPGVVLTVVGSYGNEHTFARFGAWHVSGIVILGFATVLLIAGIILKCCYRPIMSADIEQHLSPNPSMITGSKNLGHATDPDDPDSLSAQRGNGNKVSPLHFPGKHNVVSTHDKTQRPHSSKKSKGSNDAHSINKNDQTNKKSTSKNVHSAFQETGDSDNVPVKKEKHRPNRTKESEEDVIDTQPEKHRKHRSRNDSDRDYPETRSRANKQEAYPHPRDPPPAYDEISDRQLRSNTKGNKQGLVPPVGVGPGSDRSGGAAGSLQPQGHGGQRDLSSDANESSRFLPEKKKKKKKKRSKRRRSDMSDMAEESPETPRAELPELRLRPVLLHEGDTHQHNEHHVHFVPEASDRASRVHGESGGDDSGAVQGGAVKGAVDGTDEGAVGGVQDNAHMPDTDYDIVAKGEEPCNGKLDRDKDDPEWYVPESTDSP